MCYVADAVREILAWHKKAKQTKDRKVDDPDWTADKVFFFSTGAMNSDRVFGLGPLTLAGHAYWLIAGLAHAVVDGGAAGLGGVLRIRTWQAGTWASWSSLWFIGARWTSWGGWRRYRFLTWPKKKVRENLDSGYFAKRIRTLNWQRTWQFYESFHQMNMTK